LSCRPYRRPQGDDQLDLSRDEFGSHFRESVHYAIGVSLDKRQIFSLDIPELTQRGEKLNDTDVVSCGIIENTNSRSASLSLRWGSSGPNQY
jgi:hypothetical protein